MDRDIKTSGAIAVLPLGGTIACVPSADGGVYPTTDSTVMQAVLVEALTSLCEPPHVWIVPELGIPSADLDLAGLVYVVGHAERLLPDRPQGIVVTTGTDSLEEVAFVLDLLWQHDVPLIVTGAMRNSTLPSSDGPGNVRDAVLVASHQRARGAGVLVVMSGEIHQAWRVQKMHTGLVCAFHSPNGGPTGHIQEDTVRFFSTDVIDRPIIGTKQTGDVCVAIIKAALGDDGRILAQLSSIGYSGAVLEVMGGGSVPRSWVKHLEALTRELPMVYSSRTGAGPTLATTYSGAGAERSLRALGIIPSGLLPPLKARLLLQLLLRRSCTPTQIASAFEMFNQPRSTGHRPCH